MVEQQHVCINEYINIFNIINHHGDTHTYIYIIIIIIITIIII